MPLTWTVEVDEVQLIITNRREVVEAMAVQMENRLRARTLQGQGAKGPLPAPKDGGKAYNRTGSLIASIGHVMGTFRDGSPYAIIYPQGNRPEHVARAEKKRAAKEQRKSEEKAAAAIGRALAKLGGKEARANARALNAQLKAARSIGRTLAKIGGAPKPKRGRTVKRQMDLASILALPGTGRNQGRAAMVVFEPKETELTEARAIAQAMMEPVLVPTGRKIVRSV